MKNILENSSKVIALLGFALLMITLVRDWGFFFVIGPQFQALQSPYDYLANSIYWLPQNLLFVVAVLAVGFVISHFAFGKVLGEQPRYFEGIGEKSKGNRRYKLLLVVMIAGAIAGLVGLFFSAVATPGIAVFFGATIVLLGEMIFFQRHFSGKNGAVFVGILIATFVTYVSFMLGNVDAITVIRAPYDVHQLTIKGGHKINVALLRNLDKGMLVWMPDTARATLYRWDQIEAVSRVVPLETETLACRFFAVTCSHSIEP
ncbi:hypothetical protein J2W51_006202 [Tardiphaga robiniae]|uniref:hypothetical protein n=1 Tax=Tardiphaga robiniae TaxID=943830 RepID=UPI002854E0EB|nr:hypothetical protein [Tardiphaga robiniae]MDR6663607.1 hypothetical protein [Tardiphaga robiniae]